MPIDFEEITLSQPYRGQLTSFGSAADGVVIKRTPFTLQGTSNGSVWTTIPSDQYFVRRKSGYVEKRDQDDTPNDVDWSSYTDWQDLGNQAFRATYSIKNNSVNPPTVTTFTNEAVTFSGYDDDSLDGDGGSVNVEIPQNLVVQEIHAEFGFIGAWDINSTYLALDSGTNSTSAGMSPSDYPFFGGATYTNRATAPFRVTTAGALFASSATITGSITATSGTIGGWTIGATALTAGSGSTTVALDSGGTNPAFYAGSATPTSAPVQIYNSGYIFAEDIVLAKGSLVNASGATGYGYAVNPLILCHFDGAFPYFTDLRGSTMGMGGDVGTYTWGSTVGFGTFFKGLYGKAVAVAEATTNHILNPSAEAAGNFGSQGASTTSRVTSVVLFGTNAFQVVLSGANQGLTLTTDALANAIHYVTFWVEGVGSTSYQVSLDNTNWNTPTLIETFPTSNTTWRRYGAQIPAAQANASTTTRLRNTGSSGTQRIDGVQVEQKTYPTPYCDGAVGLFPGQARSTSASANITNGYSWLTTADASVSSRVAATLTYPFAGNMLLNQGTLSFWTLIPPVQAAPSLAFGMYIDANNYIGVKLAFAGATGKIVGESASGGVAVDTSSGASTAATGWHHVAMTWTSGHQKVWVDGVQSGADANYLAPAGTPTTIEIGSKNLTQQCNTLIDDFCIVADVLTDHEIKSMYYSDAPLMIAVSNQEFRLSDPAGGEVFGNASGIFARGRDASPSFGLANVNGQLSSLWGGSGSTTLDAGDFMFGSDLSGGNNIWYDNSAGALYFRTATTQKISLDTSGNVTFGQVASSKANMYWDNSTSQLKFRTNTTVTAYIDTDGTYTFVAANAATDTPVVKWKTSGGVLAGTVSAYIDSVNNLGVASLNAYGTSTGDQGISQLIGFNFAQTKYVYAQAVSDGYFYFNLQSGKVTTNNAQRVRIGAVQDDSGTKTEMLTLEAHRTTGATAAGFGSKIDFYADNAAGTITYQGGVEAAFVGGTTNSNMTIAAQNLFKVSNGAGAPSVTGSRASGAALVSLLSTLATIGLISDGTSA